MANAPDSRRHRDRLHQFSQVRLAAARQYALAHFIPQVQHRAEIRTRWNYRLADLDGDSGAPGKPLVAAQQGSRPVNGARQDGKVCLGRHLECTQIKSGQARSAGERAFREEDQNATLSRQRNQRFCICKAAGDIIALDKRYPQTPQQRACYKLLG